MFELIIPPIRDLTDLDLNGLILLIIGLVVTQLYIILFFVLGGGSGPLQILGQRTGFLVAGDHLLNELLLLSELDAGVMIKMYLFIYGDCLES